MPRLLLTGFLRMLLFPDDHQRIHAVILTVGGIINYARAAAVKNAPFFVLIGCLLDFTGLSGTTKVIM